MKIIIIKLCVIAFLLALILDSAYFTLSLMSIGGVALVSWLFAKASQLR